MEAESPLLASESRRGEWRQALRAWFSKGQRDLPWRKTRDPYAIWVSEIMLQQTRVAAAIPFYARFLERFPDCQSLAEAPEEELLARWAGLGYYARARNLQKAARAVCAAGKFPQCWEEIRALPGIGDYTGAAVASIAFGLPHAAVDGNVLRVLSRVLANGTDIASAAGRKRFRAAADLLLDREHPGTYNQALMELGATVCFPRKPQCLMCPVSALCAARASGRQEQFPVKLRRTESVDVERRLFWVAKDGRVLLWQRPANARLMPGFWELPETAELPSAAIKNPIAIGSFRHGITNHNYRFEVYRADPPEEPGVCRWVETERLPSMAISTVVRKAWKVVERHEFKASKTASASS